MEYRQRRRARTATSIPIIADNLRKVLNRKFFTQAAASEAIGKDPNFLAVALYKGRINFYTLDDLAIALNMTFDELFSEIVDEEKWLSL